MTAVDNHEDTYHRRTCIKGHLVGFSGLQRSADGTSSQRSTLSCEMSSCDSSVRSEVGISTLVVET